MSAAEELLALTAPARVVFPVELRPPPGFRPDELRTWPRLEGRLEYVDGRLLYMPPCGVPQQAVTVDVARVLGEWRQRHPDFFVGGNEAGIALGADRRGADAGVWRKADVPARGFQRRPPVLAVEVEGEDEDEAALLQKARWYLAHGVAVVWLVLHSTREVLVVKRGRARRYGERQRLPPERALPGLRPRVAEFFAQLED